MDTALPQAPTSPQRAASEARCVAPATRAETAASCPVSPATFAHPALLVDPRPAASLAVRSLRQRGTPLHVLSSRWLEPALWSRGVHRHLLPALATRPEAWSARLLELAAELEPRALILPFSKTGREFLRRMRTVLAPHYELAHVEPLELHEYEAEDFRTERALRRAVLRGEPAFEVQVTLDRDGECTGACVLTWVAGVSPCIVVTSVEGGEVLERSLTWLRSRGLAGYARLIWAPDRFGRVELQAAGTLPGSGWALACADGVDFPALWYASLLGVPMQPQLAARNLSRQIPVAEPVLHTDAVPLVPVPIPWSLRDPFPKLVGLMGTALGS